MLQIKLCKMNRYVSTHFSYSKIMVITTYICECIYINLYACIYTYIYTSKFKHTYACVHRLYVCDYSKLKFDQSLLYIESLGTVFILLWPLLLTKTGTQSLT